jgi:hypothetical protein
VFYLLSFITILSNLITDSERFSTLASRPKPAVIIINQKEKTEVLFNRENWVRVFPQRQGQKQINERDLWDFLKTFKY